MANWRNRRARGRALLKERIDAELARTTGKEQEKAGAIQVAVYDEARRRVNSGNVWGVVEALGALGYEVDDDHRAVAAEVVAANISGREQSLQAKRYTKLN